MPSVTRNGGTLEIGTFRTTSYPAIQHLAHLSSTHYLEFTTVLPPIQRVDYSIPRLAPTLVEVRIPNGEVPMVLHAKDRYSKPVETQGIRSMCLCTYCAIYDYRSPTVLYFTTVGEYTSGLISTYREYARGHRPRECQSP